MKRKRLIPFMLIFLLLLLACDRNQPPPGAGALSLNLLVVASDLVELKRDGWSTYHPTLFGTTLYHKDLLKSEEEITILCDNLTLSTIPAGVPASVSNGCPPTPEPALKRRRGEIDNTRAGVDLSIPYIITPRMTRLLTDRPTLRWNDVVGASSYTVRIQVGPQTWQEVVSGTETVYSGDPPLEAGKSYLLTVAADNGRSSTEEEPTKLGFVLLSEAEAEPVRTDTATLNALDLSDEARALALAYLYINHNLIAEAIETLEGFAEEGSQTPAIYRLLGDLYRQTGLPLLAESRYTQAITLSQAANDIEGQATAQAGLGEVYATLNNQEEARRWLGQARTGYEILGDTQRVSDLKARLATLKAEKD